MSRRYKQPTHTILVLEALKTWPTDFASMVDLEHATGSSRNQVSAALSHLRRMRAVDVVIEADGSGWWFATPDMDARSRVLEERTPEAKPRRQRRIARKD